MGGEAHPSEFEKAKSAALKAIEIDDSLAEGHSALAYTIFVYNWRFAEAEKEFTRALELDPNKFRYTSRVRRLPWKDGSSRGEQGT
jgi:tetratricopeptide (TPR) repeat protein